MIFLSTRDAMRFTECGGSSQAALSVAQQLLNWQNTYIAHKGDSTSDLATLLSSLIDQPIEHVCTLLWDHISPSSSLRLLNVKESESKGFSRLSNGSQGEQKGIAAVISSTEPMKQQVKKCSDRMQDGKRVQLFEDNENKEDFYHDTNRKEEEDGDEEAVEALPPSIVVERCGRTTYLGLNQEESGTTEYLSAATRWDITERWAALLGKCIDASPLVTIFKQRNIAGEGIGDEGKRVEESGTSQDGRAEPKGLVFVGSHAHNFGAWRLEDGVKQWVATLGGRVEGSAALSR